MGRLHRTSSMILFLITLLSCGNLGKFRHDRLED